MALGLGHLFHVHQDRNVVFSAPVCGSLIGGDKRGVIPTLHAENDQTIGALFHFHAAQRSRNRSFGRLILLRYADAVTIVPHIHEHGHFKHAGRVHGFPEQAFRCARIADGPDGNLIAATRKTWFIGCDLIHLAVKLGGLGQSQQAGHLPSRRTDIGRAVELPHVVHPSAVIVEEAGGKVPSHLSSCRSGFALDVSIRIQCSEVLFDVQQPFGHHQGLVSVVTGTPIPIADDFGQSNLS